MFETDMFLKLNPPELIKHTVPLEAGNMDIYFSSTLGMKLLSIRGSCSLYISVHE